MKLFKVKCNGAALVCISVGFYERKGWDMWPSMMSLSKCTHTHTHTAVSSEHTHTHTHTHTYTHTPTVNTHPEQWAANTVAPREQLGVRCLAQGHLSCGIEALPPPTVPAGLETRTCDLRVTNPTLYIRPRLYLFICIYFIFFICYC